jgi:DNA transposition AAA+ family ATPase
VEIWEEDVLCLPVPSNLTQESMLKILGQATGGYIGLLDMVLRETAIRALENGLSKITKDILQEVAQEYC